MEKLIVPTSIGDIAVFRRNKELDTSPLLMAHGVYFDHRVWEYQANRINDHPILAIDMPQHGESKENIDPNWNLTDCGKMLVEIIHALDYNQVIGIGHSWGSMSLLRAAYHYPDNFNAIGLCNLPFKASTLVTKLQFLTQHLMLPFRGFYTKQVAKVMFSSESLREDQTLINYLRECMSGMRNADIRKTDRAVIIGADDMRYMLEDCIVPAFALKGEEDYVPSPESIPLEIVNGGHVSPLEAPDKVNAFIQRIINSAK
jgi:pimeloyl-ACP methyl ester carboxylesterase